MATWSSVRALADTLGVFYVTAGGGATLAAMLLLAPAFATPEFRSEDPGVPPLALRAWAAARVCTGREAQSAPVVPVIVHDVSDKYAGRAHKRQGALQRIELDRATSDAGTIAHEIAHAWFPSGDAAIGEGLTSALADCISRRDPVFPLRADRWEQDLAWMGDLRDWGNHGWVEGDSRMAGYAGAHRMMASAARILGEEAIFNRVTDFPSLHEILRVSGGTVLSAAIEGGVSSQRTALDDADGDGITRVVELATGTSPEMFDTDGDGWWDGATPVKGAVLLPTDGTPICAGRRSKPGEVPAALEVGRSPHFPLKWEPKWIVGAERLELGVVPAAGMPVLISAPTAKDQTPRRMWVVLPPGERGSGCIYTPRITVWTVGITLDLPALTEAIDTAYRAAADQLGAPERRLSVVVAASSEVGGMRLDFDNAGRAQSSGDFTGLAAAIVAWHRHYIAAPGADRRWTAYAAWARSQVGPTAFVPWEKSRDVKSWTTAAARCPTGWKGILDGTCSR